MYVFTSLLGFSKGCQFCPLPLRPAALIVQPGPGIVRKELCVLAPNTMHDVIQHVQPSFVRSLLPVGLSPPPEC
jgi:hypothetical protein